MRVVVSGATGFLGHAVVGSLARSGHDVIGLVRSPAGAARVRAQGGRPLRADLVRRPPTARDLAGVEAIVHLAQGDSSDLPAMRAVRVGGARRLVAAGRRAGVRRLLVGSGYWVYPNTPGWITERTRVAPMGLSRVNFDTEEVARRAAAQGRLETSVVRPGMVYGAGSWFGEMLRELRAGTYRYLRDGEQYMSPISLEDTADAFVTVLDNWRPGSVYIAVDDQPVTQRRFAEDVARAIHAPAPSSLSLSAAEKAWGRTSARLNVASRRASNRHLRSLGWRPRYPTYRKGLVPLLRQLGRPRAGRT